MKKPVYLIIKKYKLRILLICLELNGDDMYSAPKDNTTCQAFIHLVR
jgi:hypothetical protein